MDKPYPIASSSYTMKDFYPTGRYVEARLSDESSRHLKEFTNHHGITQTLTHSGNLLDREFEFHVTLIFTYDHIPLPLGEIDKTNEPYEIFCQSYEMFGSDKDIPVLKVSSPGLALVRATYEKLYTFKEDYPWSPHISLSYDKNHVDISSLPVPEFSLFADRIFIKEVE